MKKEFFTTEDVRQFLVDCGRDPEKFDLEERKNLYNVLAEMTEHKLSKDDIMNGFSWMINTLTGNRPEVIDSIPDENAIRALTRYMEVFDEFRGKLDILDKFKFSFCVWYVAKYGLEDFADAKRIEELFWEDRRNNEERYWLPESYLITMHDFGSRERNDLVLLANAIMDLEMKSFDLLRPRLAENCKYISKRIDLELDGVEQIENHFRSVNETESDVYFCYLAKLVDAPEDSEFKDRIDCMPMAFIDERHFISVAFIDYDEDGLICRINMASGPDYCYKYLGHLIPEYRDDYGTLSNPIEVTAIPIEYMYMDSLVFADGTPVYYERTSSWRGSRVNLIDKFLVWRSQEDMEAGKDPEAELFLYGYGKKNSTEAPNGFRFGFQRDIIQELVDEVREDEEREMLN